MSDAPAPAAKSNPLAAVGGVIGAAVGYGIGKYAWMMLLIPGVAGLIAGAILAKTAAERHKAMVFAAAVQIGQGVWMAAGLILAAKQLGLDANSVLVLVAEAAFIIIGGGLLAFLPGWPLVGVMSLYQSLALAWNTYAIFHSQFGTDEHKALAVHIVLRAAALIGMFAAKIAIDKQQYQELQTQLLTSDNTGTRLP